MVPPDDFTDGEPEWVREAAERAERRFQVSKPDLVHEFSDLPQIGLRQIRGTYFSVHDNRNPPPTLPERFHASLLVLHSEKNRFRALCEQIVLSWLPEFPHFLSIIESLELGDESEQAAWQAESFGIAVHPDCYRLGNLGGTSPIFAARDLLLDLLILVLECLLIVGEDLDEWNPGEQLAKLKTMRARLGDD